MMTYTTIKVGKSLLDEVPIGSHFKERMGLFKDVDSEGCDIYTAYWTDGHDMLVFQTYNDDKEIAEWVLNHLVFRYWKNKLGKRNVGNDSDYDNTPCAITNYYGRKDL